MKQGRQRVVAVDGHSFAGENFAAVGVNHLIASIFDDLAVERFKSDRRGAQSLLQCDLVSVDEIVAVANHRGVVNPAQDDNEVTLAFQSGVVAPA